MPISFAEVVNLVGRETADRLEQVSIDLYRYAHDLLEPRGIILSDTKFEFGERDGEILLIDEALTPDSSRFWEAASYGPSGVPQSYDKQFVRDYVESLGWNKQPPAPELPDHVIAGTTSRYLEIFSIITGQDIAEEGTAG
jgi:phosphoribosylaminoimidazole-succinocarboxamide synthase